MALVSIPGIEEYSGELSLMGGEPLQRSELPEVLRLSRDHLPKMRILAGMM